MTGKELTLFGILILHKASKIDSLTGERLSKGTIYESRLQTRTSLLSCLNLNSPIKDRRESERQPLSFPYQSTIDENQNKKKKKENKVRNETMLKGR